jgi:hypothetical protein
MGRAVCGEEIADVRPESRTDLSPKRRSVLGHYARGSADFLLELQRVRRSRRYGRRTEIQFRGGNPKEWHSGTFATDGDLITVTAPDDRKKSAQIRRTSPELMERLLRLELERDLK